MSYAVSSASCWCMLKFSLVFFVSILATWYGITINSHTHEECEHYLMNIEKREYIQYAARSMINLICYQFQYLTLNILHSHLLIP